MFVSKTPAEQLQDAVTNAGGAIAPRRLPPDLLAALPLAPSLHEFACETCRVVLIGHRRRRFCPTCASVREGKAQWQREKARRARRGL